MALELGGDTLLLLLPTAGVTAGGQTKHYHHHLGGWTSALTFAGTLHHTITVQHHLTNDHFYVQLLDI